MRKLTHVRRIKIAASSNLLPASILVCSANVRPVGRPRGHACDLIAQPLRDTATENEEQGVASITAAIGLLIN